MSTGLGAWRGSRYLVQCGFPDTKHSACHTAGDPSFSVSGQDSLRLLYRGAESTRHQARPIHFTEHQTKDPGHFVEPMWSEHGIRMQEGSGEEGRREGELFLRSELRTFWTGGTSLLMNERRASPEDSLQEGRKGPEPFQSK